MAKFKWWWDDPTDLKVWEKLNALSQEERESRYGALCTEMVKKYGNIFFFKPQEQQEPVLTDNHIVVNVHGQNSSGKSYSVGAKFAYHVTGKSPYEEVPEPEFGIRTLWIITTSYQIQTNSSQTILFSNLNSPKRDIGLLPPIEVLEAAGATVVWEKGKSAGILKSILMPDGKCKIEFKSMESGAFSIAGAAVDGVWVDEICPQDVYNEVVTRVLRKNGRVFMSYLVGGKPLNKKIPGAWVVDDLFPQHERKVSEIGFDDMSFHFFIVEKNTALDPEQVKKIRLLTTEEERAWRFAPGGKFNIRVEGRRMYAAYKGETHLKENLIEQVDEFDILYRVWDLGYRRPCCTMWQADKYNRVKIYSTVLGDNEILHEFIPRIQRHIQNLFPGVGGFLDLLPHDARRRDGNSPKTAEMIFQDHGCKNIEVIYVHVEDAIRAGNTILSRLIGGIPAVQIDPVHAALMGSCLELHTRNEETGDPLKDGYYEHVSDNFKLMVQFLLNNNAIKALDAPMIIPSVKPGYLSTTEPTYKE
jgi:hypothetical protein